MVLNVYGSESIETVENAIDVAIEDGARTRSEALREVCAAFTGWDAGDR